MTSSESEGKAQPPPRKRSRTSTGSEAAGKKARGRPRVDTTDATAADRRRTQIRLAQRAYRQRKETTISSLKQQAANLQSIIEQMNKSFLRFNDSAVQSGLLSLNPSLALEMKHVTETFVSLAKSAAESSSEGDEDVDGAIDPAAEFYNAATVSRASQDNSLPDHITGSHTDIGWGYSASFAESPPSTADASPQGDVLGSTSFFPPIKNSTFVAAREQSLVRMNRAPLTVAQLLEQSRGPTANQSELPFGMVNMLTGDQTPPNPFAPSTNFFPVNIPTPEITPPITRLSTPLLLPNLPSLSTKSLQSNWTYSHEETTFARRLTRAALETGFHLLSSASIRPAALNYVFRLSLPYMTLDQLRDKFKLLLSRGTDEELDCWDTPFIHLGGAGTWYPAKDEYGNVKQRQNSWTVRSIGPPTAKLARVENAQDPSRNYDLAIDLTGFEGEWFDSDDVQGYLEQEKGCYINPRESFAEVMVEVDNDANAGLSNMVHSKTLDINLDFPTHRRSHSSVSPGLTHTSSSTDSLLTQSHSAASNSTDSLSTQSLTTASSRSESLSTQAPTPPTTAEKAFASEADMPFGLDMSTIPIPDFSKLTSEGDFFEQPLGLDLAPGFDTSFQPTDYNSMAMDMMGVDADIPVVKQKRRRAALVDVSKLIEEIIRHGVCLGRSPGFRRNDVDKAFEAAIIHGS
ncbi:hypothetical protein EJ04DRAFT_511563 [Polyplosphaeria fusca]|uniref:BZIP domain-containing protein n=1 Tax=Polyplosphaeria fusca TaxID=682080 RepID=A0A9P4QY51_9PLEO|nr:hypothetical protein EJ04DRAFT_511563 [Polyplosphaeria fusca]